MHLLWVFVLALSLVVPVWGYLISARQGSGAIAILAHPTAFGLFWWVSYPLKAAAVQGQIVITQTGAAPSEEALLSGVVVSMVLALAVLSGSALGARQSALVDDPANMTSTSLDWRRPVLVLILLLFASLYVMLQTVWKDFTWNEWAPYEQNSARYGNGWLFFWSDAWTYVAISFVAAWLCCGPKTLSRWRLISLGLAVVALLAWAYVIGVAFSSRRVIVAIAYAIAVGLVVVAWRARFRRLAAALALVVATGPVALSAGLQSIRYAWIDTSAIVDVAQIGGDGTSAKEAEPDERSAEEEPPAPPTALDLYLQATASSFEGGEHIGQFLFRGGWRALMLGVDRGEAWLFNFGASMIPRQVWPDKPVVAGTTAEQCWLWPDQCPGTRWDTAYLPPGFVVDFLYGFGVLGAFVLAFVSGWLLARAHMLLWAGRRILPVLISICTYIFLFNFVRGGTAFVQFLLVVGGIGVMAWGLPKVRLGTPIRQAR